MYKQEAIDWLSAHPAATPGGIGTLSMSKGSEFAMMGAAVSDKVTRAELKDKILECSIGNMKGIKCNKNNDHGCFTLYGLILRWF